MLFELRISHGMLNGRYYTSMPGGDDDGEGETTPPPPPIDKPGSGLPGSPN